MAICKELLDELLDGYQEPTDLMGSQGILQQLTKALIERVLEGELTHHLGYQKHDPVGINSGNSRNGKTLKVLKGEAGELPIAVPRDRNGAFAPQMIKKHQTRFDGFDEKIIALYARGLTVRDIQAHLEEMYGVEVSPGLISTVTDEVQEEIKAWQQRPLDKLYLIIYLDALVVKVRQEGRIANRAIYVAVAVNLQGKKRSAGVMGHAKRRGEVLARCHDGIEKSRRGRFSDRVCGWVEGVPGGD